MATSQLPADGNSASAHSWIASADTVRHVDGAGNGDLPMSTQEIQWERPMQDASQIDAMIENDRLHTQFRPDNVDENMLCTKFQLIMRQQAITSSI